MQFQNIDSGINLSYRMALSDMHVSRCTRLDTHPHGILLVNFFFETLFETLAKIDLGGRRVARELRDHQETHFGERFYKNLHSQLPLAAENHHLQV